MIRLATQTLGFLVPRNTTWSFAQWAQAITRYYDDPKAQEVARHLSGVGGHITHRYDGAFLVTKEKNHAD